MDLHGLAALKADGEILDELALVGQGLGGVDDALGFAPHGRDKDLLRGDVGVKEDVVQRIFTAALEFSLWDHADPQVRAVAALVDQRFNVQAVEIGAAGSQIVVVGFPGCNGVLVDAGSVQDRLPQLFHRLGLAQVGEQLFRPGHTGHSGDTPLVLVLELVPVGLDDLVLGLLGLGHLLLVDALHAVRVLGNQVDAAGDLVDIVLPAGFLPVGDSAQVFLTAPADLDLVQRLIAPVHDDPFGTGAVALLRHHLDEFRLIQLSGDKDLLALLHVDAHGGNEFGIASEYGFFHVRSPLFDIFFIVAEFSLHFNIAKQRISG